MKATIKLGIVGVGGYGGEHLKAIRKLEQAGDVQLVAVADPNIFHYKEASASFQKSKVRLYEDYDEMLAKESALDGVSIAAPIPYHFEIAQKCLAHDIHVYLEKPPVPLLGQLDHLIQADTKHRITVGFQMVESALSRQIKSWVVNGRLGKVREIRTAACWPRPDSYYHRANWAGRMVMDGKDVFDGPATNALSHLVHNIMFLASDRVDEFEEPVEVQGEMYRARPIESYDVACLRWRVSSEICCFAALTHATKESLPFQLEVIGSKGWARVSEDGRFVESPIGCFRCNEDVGDAMLRSYAAFLGYVKGDRKRPPVLLRDARGYSLATTAMLQSSGGIHAIDESWVRHIKENGDGIWCVHNLRNIVEDSMRNPLLFSERDLPWAVRTPVVVTRRDKDGKSGVSDFEILTGRE